MSRLPVVAAIGAIALGVAACGSTTTVTVSQASGTTGSVTTTASTTTTTTVSATPTPKPELLFAVVESHAKPTESGLVDDTVAIVGLDGIARNKATIAPRTPPAIGNAAPILQPDAQVAAGQVFYIDGLGVVRALAPAKGSSPRAVTSFPPPSPQGYTGFAVSPDGQHLVASVDTLTAFQTPGPNPPSDNPFGTGGEQVRDDILAADAGGAAHVIRSIPASAMGNPAQPLTVTAAWDATGPIGLTSPPLGTQNGYPDGWASAAVHIDAGGNPGSSVGGAGCTADGELADGTAVCETQSGSSSSTAATIRAADGKTLYSVVVPQGYTLFFPFGLHLSPDGSHCTVNTQANSSGTPGPVTDTVFVAGNDGKVTSLATNFQAQGWLDGRTVIGRIVKDFNPGNLAYVSLDNPGKVNDLGFAGQFIGVVQNAV